MAEAFRVIGGLCVLGLIAGALHASATLPSSARVPLHLGVTGYGTYVHRTIGLVVWPVVGITVYLMGSLAPYEAETASARWILLAVLIALVPTELGAFRKAQRESDRTKRRRR